MEPLFRSGLPVIEGGVPVFTTDGDCLCCDTDCASGVTFAYTVLSCLAVCFQAIGGSCDVSECTYEWDFGDGGTSTENHPGHVYEAEGTYEVCITATCGDGSTFELCDEIEVTGSCNCCGFEENCPEPVAWGVSIEHDLEPGCAGCASIAHSFTMKNDGGCSASYYKIYPAGSCGAHPLILVVHLSYFQRDGDCYLHAYVIVNIDDDDDVQGNIPVFGEFESLIEDCLEDEVPIPMTPVYTSAGNVCEGLISGLTLTPYIDTEDDEICNPTEPPPDPPDPPPPPVDNCDSLDDCEDNTTCFLTPNFPDDYNEAFANHFILGGSVSGTSHWYLSNLNIDFYLPQDGGIYDYALELYTPGTYASAVSDGILIREDEFDPSPSDPAQCEVYVYKIEVGFECINGRVRLEYIVLHYDVYIGFNGGPTWPDPNGQTFATFQGALITDYLLESYAGNCRTGPTYTRIEWADDPGANTCILNPLDPSGGADHTAFVMAQINFGP